MQELSAAGEEEETITHVHALKAESEDEALQCFMPGMWGRHGECQRS